jgi:hypothetical protein
VRNHDSGAKADWMNFLTHRGDSDYKPRRFNSSK